MSSTPWRPADLGIRRTASQWGQPCRGRAPASEGGTGSPTAGNAAWERRSPDRHSSEGQSGDWRSRGGAFLPLAEAEETYRELSAQGHRLTTDGFSAEWSPDGKKLAFSMGVIGNSGVALYDSATKETDLLIVPGKYPRWSPDGQVHRLRPGPSVPARAGIRGRRPQEAASCPGRSRGLAHEIRRDRAAPAGRRGLALLGQGLHLRLLSLAGADSHALFDLHRGPER